MFCYQDGECKPSSGGHFRVGQRVFRCVNYIDEFTLRWYLDGNEYPSRCLFCGSDHWYCEWIGIRNIDDPLSSCRLFCDKGNDRCRDLYTSIRSYSMCGQHWHLHDNGIGWHVEQQ